MMENKATQIPIQVPMDIFTSEDEAINKEIFGVLHEATTEIKPLIKKRAELDKKIIQLVDSTAETIEILRNPEERKAIDEALEQVKKEEVSEFE